MASVGIFWIHNNGEIFMIYKEEYTSQKHGTTALQHAKYWYDNKNLIPKEYINFNYQAVPRGRVVYDELNKKFLVFLNQNFTNNQTTQQAIKEEFGIASCEFLYDAHYDTVIV